MWNQILIVATAFGFGYYYATRKSKTEEQDTASNADREERILTSTSPIIGPFSEEKAPTKKKKRNKNKKTKKQEPLSQEAEPCIEPVKFQDQKRDDNGHTADAISDGIHEENDADDWESVTPSASARLMPRESKAIPTHDTAWDSLSKEPENKPDGEEVPSARVLRIGEPARSPPTRLPRIRRTFVEPEPLTRKQRQNQRKTDRQREQRQLNAELQDERLRQHQRQLMESRSMEQWKKAKKSMPPSSKKHPGSSAAVIDGKLIWD